MYLPDYNFRYMLADMKSLADRLKEAMINAGITQAQLAQLVDVSQPAINRLVTGKTTSSRKITEIARVLSVSPGWLVDGVGGMQQEREPVYHPDTYFDSRNENLNQQEPWDHSKPLDLSEADVPYLNDIDSVPDDGKISHGESNYMFLRVKKDVLSQAGARVDGSGVVCFLHSGDSMDPFIPDGSRVFIDCNNKKIIDGKIYVISQNGWKRLRQLYRTAPELVSIRSFNTANHPDEEAKMGEFEVVGRVFMTSTLW